MKILYLITFIVLVASGEAKDCQAKKSNQKLFCYYGRAEDVNSCKCTHIILPATTDSKAINSLQDKLTDAKILLTVKEFNEELVKLLETSKIDGLEINLSKFDSKSDLGDFISTIKTKLGEKLYIAVSVPAKTEILAKYYDFKALSKSVDTLILQTHLLGASRNVTFHPSRLSGLWDVQNTDSVVDLVSGLGAPLSKLVISSPVQAFKFTLQNENFTAPGSPALELSTLTRNELCQHMKSNEWTLERDEDQAGPYIFREKNWIAFEDATSIDIKAKYARVRGLAGLALKDLSQDGGEDCGETILESAFSGLSKQARAPRGAVLHSLEREILENPTRPFDNIQVSPYRITRVIDVEGKVNAIRQDTRTEFECSRQGYFVHPRSCGRFYRCVKFDQLSDEFSVFEFDCPAGLAFDERVEVCVWPGSLPDASACSGSSEIAPVPKNRFVCPGEPGYYADVENCRWFFACLDHGKSPLSAYEFRCPFGLVFDEDRLLCEWPWLVPKCASGFGIGGDYSYKHEARSDEFALDLYDGLGTLNGIQLGGLAGKFEQPVAKTYSTFTQAKGRSNNFGNDLFDSNSQRFEYESQKSHEIDLQNYLATQNYQAQNFEAHSGTYDVNGHLYNIQNAGSKSYDHNQGSSSYSQVNQHNFGDQSSNEYNQGSGFVQNNQQYYDQNQGSGTSYAHTSHVDHQNFADQSYQNQGYSHYENINQNNAGVTSYAQTSQINSNNDNLKIIAGGYSGVASGLSSQNVEISQHGLNLGSYDAVTPVSLVSSTAIPTVTSLPIPSSTLNFDVYHGGVVANLPNLQHKLEHPSTINDQLANLTFYASTTAVPDFGYDYPKPSIAFEEKSKSYLPPKAKTTNTYVKPLAPIGGLKSAVFENKFVKTELKPIQPAFMSTYTYSQPSYYQQYNSFGNKGRGYSKPNYIQSSLKEEGYYYGKPYINLQQTPVHTYSYQQPLVVEHNVVKQGYHYEQPKTVFIEGSKVAKQNEGYIYNKPAVSFVEGPKVVQQQGYVYQKPAVTFVEQPKLVTQHSQINHHHQESGYVYEKPKTTFIEQPKVETTGYVYEKPAVTFVEQPKLVTQHSQINHHTQNGGYVYEKPKTTFIEQPTKVETTGYVYEKPAVTFGEKPLVTQHTQINHHNQEGGYVYEKPQTTFIEEPTKVQTTGYVYEKPSVAFVEQPKLVTQHTQINHHNQDGGYVYEKPKTTFIEQPKVQTTGYVYEKPAVTFVEQPKLVTQHSQINHHHQDGGYVYEKPKTTFIEQPKVQTTGYVYEKPAVTFVEQPKLVTQHSQINHYHQDGGYVYEKPKTTFIEQPKVETTGYVYEKPSVTFVEQPKLVTQHSQINHHTQNGGYVYEKPKTTFIEQPTKVETTGYVYEKPAVTFEEKPLVTQHSQINHHTQNGGYVYEKPKTTFIEQPTKVETTGYVYEKPGVTFEEKPLVTQHTQVNHHTQNTGYVYEKPTVAFVEGAKKVEQQTYIYNKPETKVQTVQKIDQGYIYEKPRIKFEEKPLQITPAVSHQVIHQYEQPKTEIKQEGYIYEKPVFNQNVYHHTEHKGYEYQKPAVSFVEQPKVHVHQNIDHGYVYNKPVEQTIYQKPVVNLYQETAHKGYAYDKPAIAFVEEPKKTYVYEKPVQPTQYNYVNHVQSGKQETVYQQYAPVVQNSGYYFEKPAPTTPTPIIHQYIKEAPKPVVYSQVQHSVKPTYQQVITQPQIISSFSINEDTQKHGYYYNKPAVAFEEKPVEIYNPPPTVKTVQTYLPPVKKVETYLPPVKTVQSYLPLVKPTQTYLPAVVDTQEVYEEPIVPKKAYVTGNTGYVYPKPEIKFEERVVFSTPKPTYSSTVASIVAKIEEAPLEYYSYDNQDFAKVSTEAPIQVSTQNYVKQSRPIVRYEFSSLDKIENQAIVEEPTRTYIPVKTYLPKTPAPTYIPAKTLEPIYVPEPTPTYLPVKTPESTYIPVVTKTKIKASSRPIVRYEFSSFDSKYNQDYAKIETPAPTYLPVTRATKRPIKNYLPPITSTTERYVEVTNPSREYLPVTQEIYKIRTRVTTEKPVSTTVKKINREYLPVTTQATRIRKPSREYLPVVEKSGKQIENYEADTITVSTRRPKVVKVLKSKTIVKNNDFHPLLSAKLGAQCTCVSNTLTLRRRPQNKIKNEDDSSENYPSDNHSSDTYESDNYENYPSEEIKIVTRKPVVTTEPVTQAIEVFTKKSRRPAVRIVEDDEDEESLKLVKSAVREGVREGIKQALATKDFDRYGPGGFRSRSETLQGTVDCQRAGLFRHPTQCNKFYSCRWDCVKKKFTLHVFNCPVHLTFDSNLGACNWPSQGPACVDNTLLPSD